MRVVFPPGEVAIENGKLMFSVYLLTGPISSKEARWDVYKEKWRPRDAATYPAYARLLAGRLRVTKSCSCEWGQPLQAAARLGGYAEYIGSFDKGCSLNVGNLQPGKHQLRIHYRGDVVGSLDVAVRGVRTNNNRVAPVLDPDRLTNRPYFDSNRGVLWVEKRLMHVDEWLLAWINVRTNEVVKSKTESVGLQMGPRREWPLRTTHFLSSDKVPGTPREDLRFVVFRNSKLVGQYRVGSELEIEAGQQARPLVVLDPGRTSP